ALRAGKSRHRRRVRFVAGLPAVRRTRKARQVRTVKPIQANILVDGIAEGEAVILPSPLSLWGGFDPATGRIIERSHPCFGETLTGRILVMSTGRGSSSASSILAESIRVGTAPLAIVLAEPDPILIVGSLVARKLYGRSIPIVACAAADWP